MQKQTKKWSKSARKESKQITCNKRFIDKIKFRYECWQQESTYDSQIHKSEINELEDIRAEDLYGESETYDFKEHIIHNNSYKNYEENN